MTVAWVVGAGGLLGRALTDCLRQHRTDVFSGGFRFAWHDEERLRDELERCVTEFTRRVREAAVWEIHWAAGISGMGSPESAVEAETRSLRWLVHRLEAEPSLHRIPGRFLVSSSAGGIYAGFPGTVADEESSIAPTTPYAHGKLEQEEILRRSKLSASGCRVLLARFSNLYGPSLPGDSRQGLITTMARCVVTNRPVPIFVPLDTARDYIDSRDAAEIAVAALRSLPDSANPQVKIVASETLTTVAELLATFRRIAHHRLLFTTHISNLVRLYTMRFRFRSRVLPVSARFQTPLPQGMARVLAAERLSFQRPRALESPAGVWHSAPISVVTGKSFNGNETGT